MRIAQFFLKFYIRRQKFVKACEFTWTPMAEFRSRVLYSIAGCGRCFGCVLRFYLQISKCLSFPLIACSDLRVKLTLYNEIGSLV